MPELPEVETMVRGIRPLVKGRELYAFRKCRCACRPISIAPDWNALRRRVVGQTVVDVRRIAKRIVFDLKSGDALVIEPRMTGLMLIADPPDTSHLRLEWTFRSGTAEDQVYFWDRRGLGTLRLYGRDEFDAALGPQKLGLDALAMSAEDWIASCRRSKRPIKVALLDQKLAAGIGNLYASEILHLAKIHPGHLASDLKPPQIRRMHEAVQQVLQTAIKYEGSTLSDGTYRNAVSQNGRYQNEHRVYARAGEVCPTCRKRPIERIVQAQRSTFFCPQCQRGK